MVEKFIAQSFLWYQLWLNKSFTMQGIGVAKCFRRAVNGTSTTIGLPLIFVELGK
jgi:hypothetical protein